MSDSDSSSKASPGVHVCASRRRFLQTLAVAGAVAPLASACGSDVSLKLPPDTGPLGLPAGTPGDYPLGTVKVVSGTPAGVSIAMGHDANGFYAMTLICPHVDCDIAVDGTITATDITCTCHNSVFSLNGELLSGPARKPGLVHYKVNTDSSGNLYVMAGEVVDMAARVKV